MKKRVLISTVALSLFLTGCVFEVQGPDEPYIAENETETPVVTVPEVPENDSNDDNQIEKELNTSEENTIPEEDEQTPNVVETNDDDTYLPGSEEWNFTEGEGEIPEGIIAKNASYNEGEYSWYEYKTDMNKDGFDEQFVIVETQDPVFSDISGELWFVDGDGNASSIGTEDYIEYYGVVSAYDYGTQVHVAIGYTSGIGGNGYLFSYKDGMLKEHSFDFTSQGYKGFTEDGKAEYILESYEAYLDNDPDFGDMWTGHTWVPYYYSFNGTKYVKLNEKGVSIEEVQSIANFDESDISSEEEVYEYVLVGEDRLMVNTQKTDGNKSKSFNIYFYTLDKESNFWNYKEKRAGIYHIM